MTSGKDSAGENSGLLLETPYTVSISDGGKAPLTNEDSNLTEVSIIYDICMSGLIVF